MLNQRLLTTLLAVTTVMTTVAVNVPSSYAGVPTGSADDVGRGAARTGQKIWNGAKETLGVVKDAATACALYNNCRDAVNRQFQPQPQSQPQSQPQQPQSGNRYITPDNIQRVHDRLNPYYR